MTNEVTAYVTCTGTQVQMFLIEYLMVFLKMENV